MFLANLALAADRPSVESIFQDPQIEEVLLSPSGNYVAILGKGPEGGQILAIRDTSDLKKVTVPITDSERGIVDVHWVNDNRIVFTVKDKRIEFEGNWDEFASDRDGGNLVHLISGNWSHNQSNTGSNIKDKTLTADFGFHSVTHDGSDDVIVEKYLFNNIDIHPHGTHLYRLNTRTRQLTDLSDGKAPHDVMEWLLDGKDRPRIAVSHIKDRCINYVYDDGKSEWQELSNNDCFAEGTIRPNFLEPNGKLYVEAEYKGYGAIYGYDVAKRQIDEVPLVAISGFDYSGSAELDYSKGKLAGIHYDGDAMGTAWFDPTMKALQAKVDGLLTQTTNTINCPADCHDPKVVLVKASSDRQPTQFILYDPVTGKLISLGSTNPAINVAQMGLRDFYRYPTRDGMEIPVYVTQPAVKSKAPRPAIVLVHGGPNVRGASWEWDAQAQFFASRGYVVIQPEFRGSRGFGDKLFIAGWKQWGLGMQDDLADAAQWAIKQGWADPKHIGIVGASYGGYATLMGLVKHHDLYQFGIEWAGVTDIGLMFSRPENDASVNDLRYDMKVLIGDPDRDSAMFKVNSPIERASEITQPLLMAHGGMDRRVPIVHASKLHDVVTRSNKNVEWIVYNNEAHGFQHEDNRIDFWKHVDAFLDKLTKTAERKD